jgi:alpha-tubulin suppressor-like RCC1 family protein
MGTHQYVQEEPRKLVKSKRFSQLAVGDGYSLALTHEGDLFGWGTGLVDFSGNQKAIHKEPIPLVVGQKITTISAGQKHAAYVTEEGGVYTWGYNGNWFQGGGQLGHGGNQPVQRPQ